MLKKKEGKNQETKRQRMGKEMSASVIKLGGSNGALTMPSLTAKAPWCRG